MLAWLLLVGRLTEVSRRLQRAKPTKRGGRRRRRENKGDIGGTDGRVSFSENQDFLSFSLRLTFCDFFCSSCGVRLSALNHLNQHILTQNHGEKRTPAGEFFDEHSS